jgi:hypothetical protein
MLAQVPADLPLLRELFRSNDVPSIDDTARPDWPDSVLESGRAIQSALGQYLEFVNQVYDEPRLSTRAWEGRLREIAACSISRLAARWRRIAAIYAPPMALVVKFARRLPSVLEAICRKPRRVLRRERIATPVGRIQEVDTACLRWISQQPGRTLVEKAGHKQQLQSVRRFEDANTLENRIVRDVLVRCIAAGRRYLRDYQRFSSHERLLLVRRFVAQCRRLLRDSPIGGVPPLTVVPQPNEGARSKSVLQLVPDFATSDYLGSSSRLNFLCPDFLLVVRSPDLPSSASRYIAFWTLASLPRQAAPALYLGQALSENLSRLDLPVPVSGCILIAQDDTAKLTAMSVTAVGEKVLMAHVPRNLWTAQASLEHIVLGLLDCPS